MGDAWGSFVPSQEILQLRELTRRRKRLPGKAPSERNHVQQILEHANVKIGNVVGDVFGVSGQQIPDALMNHEEMNPAQLADLSMGRLRAKREKLAAECGQTEEQPHPAWQQMVDLSPGAGLVGAIRKRGAIFQSRFYRQQKHRGRKRAVIAACRALLVVVHEVLGRMEPYQEPDNALMRQREREKVIQHHLRKLRRLGVDLPPLDELSNSKRQTHPPRNTPMPRSAWYPREVKSICEFQRPRPATRRP